MKEYSGYNTKINGQLEDELRKTKDSNTLYITHYYFALNDGKNLIFYYNPQHYWDIIPVEKVERYVCENLEQECAVFKNFDPDKEPKNKALDNKTSHPAFFPETPRIGNHYSCLGSRIVSHHQHYYFLGDYGGCFKCTTKDLSDYDVKTLLIWAVMSKTPNYIKSIYELNCFKKTTI
jgi:hypothetical protein